MKEPPRLESSEWRLILELLERERGELPAEIRHTRTADVRESLRERERMIDALLERLREALGATA